MFIDRHDSVLRESLPFPYKLVPELKSLLVEIPFDFYLFSDVEVFLCVRAV